MSELITVELDRLRVTVQRVRQACHEPRYVRNVPGSLAFEQGYRDALEAILAILDGTDAVWEWTIETALRGEL